MATPGFSSTRSAHTVQHQPTVQAGVGLSLRAHLPRAVEDAIAQAGGPAAVRVCIAYAGVAHDQHEVVAALQAALPGVPIVGGSSQGAAVPGRTVESERFLSVALLRGATLGVRQAHVTLDSHRDDVAHGRALAAQLGPPPQTPHTTLIWYDPLCGCNATGLLEGLAEGGYARVVGGATGQPWDKMVTTFQYQGTTVAEHGATVLVLEGVEALVYTTHGAEAVGLTLEVTRVEGNVVYELDHRPALDVWCEQTGIEPDATVESSANWALGVTPPRELTYEGCFTRAPFAFDFASRAIILQASIPRGAKVQVCIRTQSAVFGGARAMFDRIRAQLEGRRPVLVAGFECGARPGPFLGSELAAVEMRELETALPPGTPVLGMYAWGEIAPVGAHSEFHNFTFPLVVLCEAGS